MDFMQEDLQEVYGYFIDNAYICLECAMEEYNTHLEDFYATDFIPVTLEEILEEGYSCCFHEDY